MPWLWPGIKAFLLIYKAVSIGLALQEWWEGPPPDPWKWWRRCFWAVVIVLVLFGIGSFIFESFWYEEVQDAEAV